MTHAKVRFTIREVAGQAGVSISTVSRAMHQRTQMKVAPATLQRIHRIAEELFYTPNVTARHLRRASFQTIGVIMPHWTGVFLNDYYCKMLAGVTDALLSDQEYQFKVVMLKPWRSCWDHCDFRAAEGIDGIILAQWRHFFSGTAAVNRLRLPCIVLNDPEPLLRVPVITADHRAGGELAAQHLWSRGHRAIAVITGPPASADSRLRVEGFQSYVARMGGSIDPDAILAGDFQEESAIRLIESFLQRWTQHVTAIFCCNDRMAIGTLKVLRSLGLRCPEDISVIGYDNDREAIHADPPLTTVHVPLYELAKQATLDLLSHLKRPIASPIPTRRLMSVSLVERQSVGRRHP